MARIYFSRGCKGMVAKRIQTDLQRQNFVVGDPLKFADGNFGGKLSLCFKTCKSRHVFQPVVR